MLRTGAFVLIGLAAWIGSSSVQAGGWDDFWCGCKADYQFNNQWPKPFIDMDRQAAVAPYNVMIANGWQRQNLIGENYFDDDTKQLHKRGLNQIRSILLQAPVEHRVILRLAGFVPGARRSDRSGPTSHRRNASGRTLAGGDRLEYASRRPIGRDGQ